MNGLQSVHPLRKLSGEQRQETLTIVQVPKILTEFFILKIFFYSGKIFFYSLKDTLLKAVDGLLT